MLKSIKEFAQRLREGGNAGAATAPPPHEVELPPASRVASSAPNPTHGDVTPRPDPREEFRQCVPDLLASLRSLFSEISRSSDQAARQKTLHEFCAQIQSLKTRLGALDLLPAWQMAASLEGLLSQLAEKFSNVTPSTLRTAAGALVSLEALCGRGVRDDLATNPAVRFLVVDDDPTVRLTVCLALKKFSHPFDVADSGEVALELASRQAYDVVFLDVEMPGINGYEVCSRIHQIAANRATPVVFVTSHSDFESRAKSTSSGGKDLIAKPFLSFEITVKALTLLMRTRLEQARSAAR